MQTYCFVLFQHGDDYHGSGVVGIYLTESAAVAAKSVRDAEPACEDCGFRFHYGVTKEPLLSE